MDRFRRALRSSCSRRASIRRRRASVDGRSRTVLGRNNIVNVVRVPNLSVECPMVRKAADGILGTKVNRVRRATKVKRDNGYILYNRGNDECNAFFAPLGRVSVKSSIAVVSGGKRARVCRMASARIMGPCSGDVGARKRRGRLALFAYSRGNAVHFIIEYVCGRTIVSRWRVPA